jgi:hypothetical protein
MGPQINANTRSRVDMQGSMQHNHTHLLSMYTVDVSSVRHVLLIWYCKCLRLLLPICPCYCCSQAICSPSRAGFAECWHILLRLRSLSLRNWSKIRLFVHAFICCHAAESPVLGSRIPRHAALPT